MPNFLLLTTLLLLLSSVAPLAIPSLSILPPCAQSALETSTLLRDCYTLDTRCFCTPEVLTACTPDIGSAASWLTEICTPSTPALLAPRQAAEPNATAAETGTRMSHRSFMLIVFWSSLGLFFVVVLYFELVVRSPTPAGEPDAVVEQGKVVESEKVGDV